MWGGVYGSLTVQAAEEVIRTLQARNRKEIEVMTQVGACNTLLYNPDVTKADFTSLNSQIPPDPSSAASAGAGSGGSGGAVIPQMAVHDTLRSGPDSAGGATLDAPHK